MTRREIIKSQGKTSQMELQIKLKDCGYYNNKGEYLLEPGNFRIIVESSSKDLI